MKPISTKDLNLYTKEDTEEFDGGLLMPLSEHIEELRSKIIISLVALCLATLLGFSFSKEIIRLLTDIMPDVTFLQIKPGELFFTSLRISLYFGLAISSPVVIWQLAGFIIPGLSLKEKKIVIPILMGAPILFCIGSLFAYYFVVPSMLTFLFGFGKDLIASSISIESFVSFTLMIMAICGCAFLLPIVFLALANVGVLDSDMLIDKWRYAILACVILGAVLTPTPDPFNMSVVSGMLIALYFLSWGVLRVANK